MSNMSYCRFHNTLEDLLDCQDNLDSPMSAAEAKCAKRLVEVCIQIAARYEVLDDEGAGTGDSDYEPTIADDE